MIPLAVIIVSYNTRELLARALGSLRVALDRGGVDARVLVVDNQSPDGSAEMVADEYGWVELHRPGANLGFAAGNNHALRALGFGPDQRGEAEAVWLLNPDTEIVDDAPARLLEHLRRRPAVGAVGPRLRYGDGRFQHGAFAFPGLAQIAIDLFPVPGRLHATRLNGRYAATDWQGTSPFEVEMLLGAAPMIRGTTIDEVGLLDESYFMYVEELDWCRRIHRAGWRLHVLPTVEVIHHEGQSTTQFREEMFVALWRSRLRYYERWSPPAYVALVRALLRLAMGWRRLRLAGRDDAATRRQLDAYRAVAAL